MATALRIRMGGPAGYGHAVAAAATGAGLSAAGGVSPRPAAAAVTGEAFRGTTRNGRFPPDQVGLTYVAPPTLSSLPTVLAPFADPAGFSTEMMRASSLANFGPRYGTSPFWTADGLYLIGSGTPVNARLSAINYATLNSPFAYGYWPAFNASDADAMYIAFSGENTLKKRSVTGAYGTTVVKTFTDYSEILIDTHACQSWNDQWWPISGKKVSDGLWEAFIWDKVNDTFSNKVAIDSAPARIKVSASGDYAVIIHNSGGQYARVYDRATMTLMHTMTTSGGVGHNDLGKDINGDDVFVSVNSNGTATGNEAVTMWRLSDNHRTHLFNYSVNAFGEQGHISCKAVDMNGPLAGGWAFVADSDTSTAGSNPPGYGQIVAIKLTPGASSGDYVTSTVKVYGWVSPDSAAPADPAGFAFVTPNRNGTLVAWKTRWAQGGSSYLFVAGMDV